MLFSIELENRCIMAALPFVLGEKTTNKHIAGELFLEVVLVSVLSTFYTAFLSISLIVMECAHLVLCS